MKINIEDYLHQIDASFLDKTKKDIYMIYIMIFGAIFAFSYLLFWDMSYEQFEQNSKKISALESKIQNDKTYLQFNPETKISEFVSNIE